MVLAHNIQCVQRTEDIKINNEATFETLMLSKNILDGLTSAGFYKPSPIQLLGIPLGKLGLDLILEAKSGTGKTVVFTTIALQKLNLNRGLQVIIVTPTREIAAQICDVLKEIGSHCHGLNVQMVIGGLSFKEDLEKLKNNVHILVGTPGRLLHLIKEKHIQTHEINLLVLDEADKLMENSFESDIRYLHSVLPRENQIILSSATYPKSIAEVVQKLFKNPHHVCPETSNVLLGVSHRVTYVKYNSNSESQTEIRFVELTKILSATEFKQCVIFCKYQARVSQLHRLLTKAKWPAQLVYGKQEQKTRLEALKTLQEYKCRIIISTDLLSRGIDSKNVDLVINFEPPDTCETYLHRIGRSGRYGSIGMAISIICEGKESINFFKLLSPITHTIDVKHFWTGETLTSNQCLTPNRNENVADDDITKSSQEESESSDSCDTFWKSLVNETTTGNVEDFNELCNSYNIISDKKIESFTDLLDDFTSTDDVIYNNCDITKYRQLDFNNITFREGFDAIKKLKTKLEPVKSNSTCINDINDEKIPQNLEIENNRFKICNEPSLADDNNSYRNEHDFEKELPREFHGSKFNNKPKIIPKHKHQKTIRRNFYCSDNTEYTNYADINKKKLQSSNWNFNKTSEKNKNASKANHFKTYSQPTAEESEYISQEQKYYNWYNQLKLRMKKIETILYIEEMSKY